MAELATIARPYAEALFRAQSAGDFAATAPQLAAVARIAADPQLRLLADNPKVDAEQVHGVIASVAGGGLSPAVQNLLREVIANGRLAALPEISAQYHTLVNAQTGVSDATVYSAFPIDDAQLGEVLEALQKRFGRKLNAAVQVDPTLIGGIRVVVGDEVLDTSVKARLEHMKATLAA